MVNILIVDDDPGVLDMVELTLRREGYDVQRALSGSDALRLIDSILPDMVVIDAGLPDMDGITLCRTMRGKAELVNTPILFLSGNRETQVAVEALNSGGDDYLRKPILPRELAARVRAHMRRASQFINVDEAVIRIFPANFRVYVNDREVHLTRVEFDLLKHLCRTPGMSYSTEDLLANVWQYPNGVGDAALVRNHIHNLRRKVEIDPERPAIIQSRHGRGYVVKARIQIEDELTARP
ncbi:MAG: response regulator transcription factor [bacterium]|nr:response regulator transcription factor [bacterium]